MTPAVSRTEDEPSGEMVSILIPAYNAEPFLHRAVLSALDQTHANLEVLVIDDASTDGTRAVAEALAAQDSRVRVLHLPVNGGPSMARNAGLDAARGAWIAVLDADDTFTPERLSVLLAVAAERKADMVADNILLYDAVAGQILGPAIDPARLDPVEVIGLHRFVENNIPGRNSFAIGLLQPIIRRGLIEHLQIRYPDDVRHGEDFLFYMGLLLAGADFVLAREAFYVCTQPVGAISGQVSGMSRARRDYMRLSRDIAVLLDDERVRADMRLAALVRECSRGLKAHAAQRELAELRRAGAYGEILRRCLRNRHLAHFVGMRVLKRLGLLVRPRLERSSGSPAGLR